MPKRNRSPSLDNMTSDSESLSDLEPYQKRRKTDTWFDRKINRRFNDMKKFVVYNSMVDKELLDYQIRCYKLEGENRGLNDEVHKLKDELAMTKLSSLLGGMNKKKPSASDSTADEVILGKDGESFLQDAIKNTPKDYNFMTKEECNSVLLRVFSTINSIDDIVNLKDHSLKYNFLKNKKFISLYKMIPALTKLKRMIGMKKVKEMVFKHILRFVQYKGKESGELLHTVINGPPGVGKTDLSKILGEIYLALGYLKKNKMVIAKRSDLVGEYLGTTSIKTQNCIDKANGGVLLIDEAYSLGDKEGRDSFAKECINTLNQNLTEKEKSLICIIVGYEKELKTNFFKHNPGLERRFTMKYIVEPYDYKELRLILLKQIEDKNMTANPEDVPEDLFKGYMEYFKFFGGDTKVLLQHLSYHVMSRHFREKLGFTTKAKLLKQDFVDGIKEFVDVKKNGPRSKYFVKSIYEN